MPSEKDPNCQLFNNREPFTQSSESYLRIKENCSKILEKSTQLLIDVERSANITFHNSESVERLQGQFNDIVSTLEKLSKEFQLDEEESMVIGTPVTELLAQIKDNRVEYSGNDQEDGLVEAEKIDTELENVIHCVLIPMQTIYKKLTKQKKNVPDVTETATVEQQPDSDLIQDNHLKTKINYELLTELEILNVEKVTRKLRNILLTVQYGKCSRDVDVAGISKKIVTLLPILEQYHLLCKFFLIQQLAAHKVSTKMLSVMLTVFVELGSKVKFLLDDVTTAMKCLKFSLIGILYST